MGNYRSVISFASLNVAVAFDLKKAQFNPLAVGDDALVGEPQRTAWPPGRGPR